MSEHHDEAKAIAQREWLEDELEGRYQVILTVDTGRRESLGPIMYALDEAGYRCRPDALGYKLDIVHVVGARPRKQLR